MVAVIARSFGNEKVKAGVQRLIRFYHRKGYGR